MKALLLSLSSFLMVATCFAEAATIHVSTSGSDATGTGASSAPFATIQKAVDASQNGDAVLVAPGTYSGEGNRAINLRGKQILLRSIAGPIQTIVDLGQRQGVLAHSTETLATVVDGFTFQNGYVESGEDWRGDGIVSILGDSAITLRNCIFRNNEIRATYVTTTTGIVVKRDRSSLEIARVENCLFYSNTIGGGGWTGVGGGQAVVVGVCGGEPAIKLIDVVNSTIANNTLYRSASGADGIRIPVSAGTVKNSIIWGNGDGFFPPTSSYPAPYQTGAQTEVFTQIDYSISEKGAVLSAGAVGNVMISNPLFTDAPNGDFTLATGSPAINAGDPSLKDVDGSRLDIGFSIQRALAGSDADGDGVNNYREAQDGTDPNDPNSFNPLSKGLVAYYPFDGNANDESGLSNNLSLTDAELAAGRSGGSAGALKLNANSSYAESANLIGVSGNDLRSVSFWVRTQEPLGVDADIISWGDRSPTLGGSQFLVALQAGNGGEIVVGGYYSDISAANLGDPFRGRWNQVTYVYSGSITGAKIYLNGKSLPVGQNGGWVAATDTWNTVDTVLRLGSRGDGRDLALAGTIVDDVRVYNRALTETEVGQLYQVEAGNLDSDSDGLNDAWERGYGRYQVVQGAMTWDQAKANAEAKGGHLATITSQAEQHLIVSFFESELREGRAGTWIGAYQTSKTDEPSGNWAWVNGEQWSYANWNVAPDNHQGDQDYGYIIGDIPGFSKWDDAPLAGDYTRYLLEFGYPTDPFNADTDGDGFNDSIETHYKTDPNNATVTPNNSRPTGKAFAWGDNTLGESNVPTPSPDAIQVAAGSSDSVVVKADGSLQSWGAMLNQSLQHIPSYAPSDLAGVVQIESGFDFKIALKGDGTVAVWGWMWDGYQHIPAPPAADVTGVVQVAAGASHYTLLKADGTVESRGSSNWGALDVPGDLTDVVKVAAGAYHSVALKRDGSLVLWGQSNHPVVYQIPVGLNGVIDIAAGDHFTVALKADGTVQAWGLNNVGQLNVPADLANVVGISASLVAGHALALTADGTVVAWGDNSLGQANVPEGLSGVFAVAAAGGHSLVLFNAPPDTDGDGIPDAYETNTGVYVSPTNTGTDPNKADTDGDGLTDGVETATFIYIDASDIGTDPNVVDSDADGLSDGVETNTGVYVGEGNTGTSPVDEDTSNDGISDGEAVLWKFNPHIDCTPMMNFLRYASETGTSGRFGLFTSNSIADLNLGGLVLQKSGTSVFLRLQLQTKAAMSQSWSNHSIVPMFLDMPGNKAFMRVRALGPQ